MNVVDNNSNLALAGLRMEIELRLREIARVNQIPTEKVGIYQLTRKLCDSGLLTEDEASAILDVVPMLNKGAHGEKVNARTIEWVVNNGPQILDSLEDKIGAQKIPDLINKYRKRDGDQFYGLGFDISKQMVKATKAFFEQMSEDDSIFEEWLRELQTTTFTVINASDEIEEQLEYAQVLKMKELMLIKVNEYLDLYKDHPLALRLLKTLEEMQIRSVW